MQVLCIAVMMEVNVKLSLFLERRLRFSKIGEEGEYGRSGGRKRVGRGRARIEGEKEQQKMSEKV